MITQTAVQWNLPSLPDIATLSCCYNRSIAILTTGDAHQLHNHPSGDCPSDTQPKGSARLVAALCNLGGLEGWGSSSSYRAYAVLADHSPAPGRSLHLPHRAQCVAGCRSPSFSPSFLSGVYGHTRDVATRSTTSVATRSSSAPPKASRSWKKGISNAFPSLSHVSKGPPGPLFLPPHLIT